MSRPLVVISSSLLVGALVGCFGEPAGEEQTGSASAAIITVDCPDVANTDVTRSLAVTDPTVLAKFPFQRVMNQIRSSANVASTETTLGVYQRWMRTFGASAGAGDCDDPNIDPNDYGLVCPRPNELELASVNPFPATSTVRFEPVALFNRFDLAPSTGANCGEYRVVYAMTSTSQTLGGRAFIIFEAALPNPKPTLGIDGCFEVARFWQGLSTDASATSRAAKLEKLYFLGTAIPGVVPVVSAANYGLATNVAPTAAGQIRTNFFVDFNEWHLREFKTRRQCTDAANPATCQLQFAHVPVKSNPAEELFAGSHARSAAFRPAFVNQVPALSRTTIPSIGLTTSNTFNEFESSATFSNVVYRNTASPTIRSEIQTRLTERGSTLTPTNILDRATTQTCAGCHQHSNGASLGGGLVWPRSLGFVHVNEARQLSSALTGTFLPHRKTVLEKFINDRCTSSTTADGGAAGAPAAADSEVTVSGAPVGAAN